MVVWAFGYHATKQHNVSHNIAHIKWRAPLMTVGYRPCLLECVHNAPANENMLDAVSDS